MASSRLAQELSRTLSKDVKLSVRHVACTPVPCEPIFAAPPGEDPESTTREDHFLAVTITPEVDPTESENNGEILVFAIEVLIYSTARLTTVFVSKADSTGYLYLLNQPAGTSLTRAVFTSFLSCLVREFQRPDVRLLLSLFARAQNQYLFPGSIENAHKHVLDDRALIKWWCRVFDPILREFEPEKALGRLSQQNPERSETNATTATVYLIVPGCDKYETKAFYPSTSKLDPEETPRWINGYPVRQIRPNRKVPPRCLVPRFPDDPKSRFLSELDDEIGILGKNKAPEFVDGILDETEQSTHYDNGAAGQWLSVKSLSHFWEMMAFRQECSAGRLVGFLWMVVNPPGITKLDRLKLLLSTSQRGSAADIPIRSRSDERIPNVADATQSESTDIPFKGSAEEKETGTRADETVSPRSKGTIVLEPKSYSDLSTFLLTLDFADRKLAVTSTKSWLLKLTEVSGPHDHGEVVIGTSDPSEQSSQEDPSNPLNSGAIFKKRKRHTEDQVGSPKKAPAPQVNVLNASLVRKKKKT